MFQLWRQTENVAFVDEARDEILTTKYKNVYVFVKFKATRDTIKLDN